MYRQRLPVHTVCLSYVIRAVYQASSVGLPPPEFTKDDADRMARDVLEKQGRHMKKHIELRQALHKSVDVIIEDEFFLHAGSIYRSLQRLERIIIGAVYDRTVRTAHFEDIIRHFFVR